MNDIEIVRKERLEQIRKEGSTKFIFKYGLSFAIIFGMVVFILDKPPISNLILFVLFVFGGLLFGVSMWLFMMWLFKKMRINDIQSS